MVCGDSWSNDFNGFRCQKQFTPAPPIKTGIHNRFIAGRRPLNFRKTCQNCLLHVWWQNAQNATISNSELKCITSCASQDAFPLYWSNKLSHSCNRLVTILSTKQTALYGLLVWIVSIICDRHYGWAKKRNSNLKTKESKTKVHHITGHIPYKSTTETIS